MVTGLYNSYSPCSEGTSSTTGKQAQL